jgi:glycerol uptake facilitator protein
LVLKSGQQISSSALRIASHRPSIKNISTTKDDREKAIFGAALQADTATKLSTFCNRPAIDAPIFNFITETIGTFALLLGVSLIEDRMEIQKDVQSTNIYSKGLLHVMIGLYITVLILSLGGPTGFSCNPCRDLGPRIAHLILPIKGKGSSEFRYSLIINSAAFLGAALAAGAFLLLKQLPIR